MDSIRKLLIQELQDLYDAEKQLVKALPKMSEAASNERLKEGFDEHLEQTRGHVDRLEQAFELLGSKAKSKPCEAMKGLVAEGKETIDEDLPPALMDSAIICAAQKVEHYEIAGYGTLSTWARSLGLDDVASLLEETLIEEKETDAKLTEVGEEVLSEVEMADQETEETANDASPEATQGTHRKGAATTLRAAGKPKRKAV